LVVTLNKAGWIVRSVILFSEAFFEGGSYVVHPTQSTSKVTVPLSKLQNSDETLDVKVLIGAYMQATHFFIHHVPSLKIGKFAFLMPHK
jgi:hypothetical protein